MESDIKKEMSKEFVTREELDQLKDKTMTDVVKIMDEQCTNENENCAVHKKLDEKQGEAFIKGVGLGKKLR